MTMRHFLWAVVFATMLPGSIFAAGKVYKLQSPSGDLKVEINAASTVSWSVEMQGTKVLEPSSLSMTLEDGTVFGKDIKVKRPYAGASARW